MPLWEPSRRESNASTYTRSPRGPIPHPHPQSNAGLSFTAPTSVSLFGVLAPVFIPKDYSITLSVLLICLWVFFNFRFSLQLPPYLWSLSPVETGSFVPQSFHNGNVADGIAGGRLVFCSSLGISWQRVVDPGGLLSCSFESFRGGGTITS